MCVYESPNGEIYDLEKFTRFDVRVSLSHVGTWDLLAELEPNHSKVLFSGTEAECRAEFAKINHVRIRLDIED